MNEPTQANDQRLNLSAFEHGRCLGVVRHPGGRCEWALARVSAGGERRARHYVLRLSKPSVLASRAYSHCSMRRRIDGVGWGPERRWKWSLSSSPLGPLSLSPPAPLFNLRPDTKIPGAEAAAHTHLSPFGRSFAGKLPPLFQSKRRRPGGRN